MRNFQEIRDNEQSKRFLIASSVASDNEANQRNERRKRNFEEMNRQNQEFEK